MRRLWKGEVVFGHDGPAGKFPVLHLDASFDEDIPLGFVAFGPNSLALAGRASTRSCCTRSSPTRPSSAACRRCASAAEQAGRDPASVRIWSCYATIGDHLPEALRLKKTVGRLATYLQGYGDLLVETNGWDPDVLARFRADEVVSSLPGAIDAKADTATLEHVATLLPDEWLEPAATGDAERCAAAGAAPVRPRRRRRDHARRDADRARTGRRRVPRDPPDRPLRRLAPEPGAR